MRHGIEKDKQGRSERQRKTGRRVEKIQRKAGGIGRARESEWTRQSEVHIYIHIYIHVYIMKRPSLLIKRPLNNSPRSSARMRYI